MGDLDNTATMEPDQVAMDTSTITFHHHGKPINFSFPKDSTLIDLSDRIEKELNIPLDRQKLYITPKIGMLKPPYSSATNHSLDSLSGKKITLMGSTLAETQSLSNSISQASAAVSSRRHSPIPTATPVRTRDSQRVKDDAMYTFHTIRPLPYLRKPERSEGLLERLKDDAGIRAAMRKWKFSVGLLTEMDPAQHTTHESRTLGLNRNQGEVIELRLRTDAYDGYRDYKTIRKTLCHELAHNVWGPHDQNFWKLCREIEAVVERDDWTRGGRSVGAQTYYEPTQEELDHVDGGGWSGGEFVVGRKPGSTAAGEDAGLSRREILARAAEERIRRQRGELDRNQRDGDQAS
jgi:WLM domain